MIFQYSFSYFVYLHLYYFSTVTRSAYFSDCRLQTRKEYCSIRKIEFRKFYFDAITYQTSAVDTHIQTARSTSRAIVNLVFEPGHDQEGVFVGTFRFPFASQRARLVVVVERKPLVEAPFVRNVIEQRALFFSKLWRRIGTGLKRNKGRNKSKICLSQKKKK